MQCFKNDQNEFIVKELTILKREGAPENFLFLPPYPENQLSSRTQKINYYCTRKIHGLNWDDGKTDYYGLGVILKSRCRGYDLVLTKGSEKRRYLEKILQQKVIDMDDLILRKYEEMPLPTDFQGCPFEHGNKRCSCKNAEKIRSYMKNIDKLFDM